MRILVDNSGYHLLNLGDISMLQVTVARLHALLPDASIEVITYSEERLAAYCPGARPVGAEFLTHPLIKHLPRKARYGLVQLHKILLPPLLALLRIGNDRENSRRAGIPARHLPQSTPTSLYDALIHADLVVASGGGYITDSFKLHALGVLTLLHYAQKMGRPTAMFGQGIGPLGPGIVHDLARRVLPRVDMLTLREGRFGPDILRSLGVDPIRVTVTGDDALETSYTTRPEQPGSGLGVNLRIAHYSGVDAGVVDGVRAVLQETARCFNAPLVSVPISLYAQDSDARSIDLLVAGYDGEIDRGETVDTPLKAIRQASKCRVLVTGSYHGAVYALGQGIPAVCLTHSGYYDYKFAGLAHLYPASCEVVSLADPAYRQKLTSAINHAWHAAGTQRPRILRLAADHVLRSQEVYQKLAVLVKEKGIGENETIEEPAPFSITGDQEQTGRLRNVQNQSHPLIPPLQYRQNRALLERRRPESGALATVRRPPLSIIGVGAPIMERGAGGEDLHFPLRLIDVDLSDPLPSLDDSAGQSYHRASLFVRLCGYPLGYVETSLAGPLSPEQTASLIFQALSGPLNRFLQRSDLAPVDAIPAGGLALPPDLPFLAARKAALAAAPGVCVILCTRNRTESLGRCLRHLLAMNYPNFEVLVVDNAPSSEDTAEFIRQTYAGCPQVRYVRENRKGLSWARNCGLRNTQAEIVAYIDDDEIADPNWLVELVAGFQAAENVACVTGAIIPAEIETQSQYWFEQYGGHSKGRGFDQFIFNTKTDHSQSALFPNPPFGAGGSMAFNAAILRGIGGFDVALGAGTPARGGEDTAAFFHILRKGYQLVFSPAALVRHFHYRDYNSLQQQFYGYGVGLTAFYTHCILADPLCIFELLRQVPKAVAFFTRRRTGSAAPEEALPPELIRTKMRGLLRGPFAYLRSLQVAKRIQ